MSMVPSRNHAEIWAEESGEVFVKDSKSVYGTFIQNKRIPPDGSEPPTELLSGDVIRFETPYQLGQEYFHRCAKTIIEIERVGEAEG